VVQTHHIQLDPRTFVENYLVRYLTPVPYHFSAIGVFDIHAQYHFITDGQPRYYNDSVVNPIPRYLVRRNDWHSEEDVQDPSMRTTMIIDEVERIMLEICSCDFIDHLNNTFDYKSFTKSQLFVDVVQCAENLHYLDFDDVPVDKRKSFYVNLYNMMAIHGLIVKRYMKMNEMKRNAFVYTDLYFIGSHRVCLKDLEYMILAQPDLLAQFKHNLRKYCLQECDLRLLFLLHYGSKGSPLPHALSQRDCQEEIAVCTVNYVNRNAIVKDASITFSHLFLKYRNMFPRSFDGLLAFTEEQLMGESKTKLQQLRKQKQILLSFHEYDSRSNQKTVRVERKPASYAFDPIILQHDFMISFSMVMENDFFRGHFRNFCKGDYSMENIIFYEKSIEFRRLTNPIDRRSMAMQIHNMFLSHDSEYEINVKEQSITEVEDVLFNRGKNRKKKHRKVRSYLICFYNRVTEYF
jgi:hypothetical protein